MNQKRPPCIHLRNRGNLLDLRQRMKDPELLAIRVHTLMDDEGVEAFLYGLRRGGWPSLRALVINTIMTPTSQLLGALKNGAFFNLRVLAFSCSCWSSADISDLSMILMNKATTPYLQHLVLLRTSGEDVVSHMQALSTVRPNMKIELRSLV